MARPIFVEQDSCATKQDSIEVEFLGGLSRQCLAETLRHKQTKPTVGVLRTEPVVEWQPKLTRASTDCTTKRVIHSGEPFPSGTKSVDLRR